MKTIFKKIKGFTLIELIVVIAIIAILATSGILLLSKWFSQSRDSARKQSLQVIKTALNTSQVNLTKYPMPDEYFTVYDTGGALAWYQGKFTDNIASSLSDIAGAPQDPKTKEYYDYSVTRDKSRYQVKADLENDKTIAYISSVYAKTDKQKKAELQGSYEGYLITQTGSKYTMRKIPSLFVWDASIVGTETKFTPDTDTKKVDITNLVNGENQDNTINKIQTEFNISGGTPAVKKLVENSAGGVKITDSDKVSGICGTGDGTNLLTGPNAQQACEVGTFTGLVDNGVGSTYTWTCAGANGGDDASCSANHVQSIDGLCGSDDGQDLTNTPTNLCDAGNASSITDNGIGNTFTWDCLGQNGGDDTSCSANHIDVYATCLATLNAGYNTDGYYWIDPDGGDSSNKIRTYCDMSNGGRTLFLYGSGGDTNFSGTLWNSVNEMNLDGIDMNQSFKYSDEVINQIRTAGDGATRYKLQAYYHDGTAVRVNRNWYMDASTSYSQINNNLINAGYKDESLSSAYTQCAGVNSSASRMGGYGLRSRRSGDTKGGVVVNRSGKYRFTLKYGTTRDPNCAGDESPSVDHTNSGSYMKFWLK